MVTVVTVILFIDVAKKWPLLMTKWSTTDIALEIYGYPAHLSRKLKTVSGIMITAACSR